MPFIRNLLNPTAFLISSGLTLALTYLKVPITTYQQITALLMVVLLFIFNRFLSESNAPTKPFISSFINIVVLIISSLLVQLLILSTGGVYSPFLILIHLYVLGSSFLVNLYSAMCFLSFSLAVLALSTYFNPIQLALVKDDPGTVLLYVVSFVVIVPLAYLISVKYHLKDQISKVLTGKVKLSESIIESLTELVVVTDTKLNITSINEAVIKVLGYNSSEIIGKPFFIMINLKDQNGVPADTESLSVSQVLSDNVAHIIKGFYLYTPTRKTPFKVSVWVRPIAGSDGKLEHISFVINEGQSPENINQENHGDLNQAKQNLEFRLNDLEEKLKASSLNSLIGTAEIIKNAEEDIILSEEIEDHSIQPKTALTDIALFTKEVVDSKKILAVSLNVALEFSLPPDEVKENSLLSLVESKSQSLPPSDFAASIDQKWFANFLKKIIDVNCLAASGIQNARVMVIPQRKDQSTIIISVSGNCANISSTELEMLTQMYYGSLAPKTGLKYGSGLEGYIAKTIATSLNLKYSTDISRDNKTLTTTIIITR